MTDDEYYEEAMEKAKSLRDVVTIGIGHNSEAKIISGINSDLDDLMEIKKVYEEESKTSVEKSEGGREEVFMSLGIKLLEGRKLHKSKNFFADWCNHNFPNLGLHVSKNEQAAILWAAEFPEQHQEILDKYPRVNTTRGAYKKWKEEQEELNAPPDDPEDETEVDTDDTVGDKVNSGNNPPPSGNSGGVGSGTTGTPNTEPLVHNITMIASCFIGVRTNLMMHKDVNSVASVSDYDLARAISFEVQKHYDDQETEAVLLELKELALQLSKAVEITLSETDHNVVAFNSK
jgi:hypothetical protein